MDVIVVNLETQGPQDRHELYRQLEQGNILRLPATPFLPSEAECELLRGEQQSQNAAHKNIAYKPHLGRTTGVEAAGTDAAAQINAVLARYSRCALAFLADLLPHYAAEWHVDYASFRPMEEQGRDLPLKRRNDLLHLDAFPTRPTHGGRILRAFTNLHPERPRVWATADPFAALAERYAMQAGLHRVTGTAATLRRTAARAARLIGMPLPDRSPYDEFMLGFHHYLKANEEFQRNGRRQLVSFAPGETWISFTDQVAHAVVSGQYALEQTCIVPLSRMVEPNLAPVTVLEQLAGRCLVYHPAQAGPSAGEVKRAAA